jgi:hypothetical protein
MYTSEPQHTVVLAHVLPNEVRGPPQVPSIDQHRALDLDQHARVSAIW